jgi:hypothetical protein
MRLMNLLTLWAFLGCLVAVPVSAGDAPTREQRIAMLKQSLQESKARLHKYEWIETTVVSKDGEQKSSEVERCYYGADGKLEKIVLQDTQGELPRGPLRRHIAEHEKQEMTDYIKSAMQLVHSYVPPVPGLLQQSFSDGKMEIQVLEPDVRARLTFADYLKPGDSLGIEINLQTNHLLGMTVSTYLADNDDPVSLDVTMSQLDDGTTYVERARLDASAKGLEVVVSNSGYRLMTQ